MFSSIIIDIILASWRQGSCSILLLLFIINIFTTVTSEHILCIEMKKKKWNEEMKRVDLLFAYISTTKTLWTQFCSNF